MKYTLLRLGLLPSFGLSASLAHLVTPLLFLGPLFGSYLRGELPLQRNWMWETHVVARYLSVHGLRNYWIVNNLVFLSSISLMFSCAIGSTYGRNCVQSLCTIHLSPLWCINQIHDLFRSFYFWFG